MLYQNPGFFWIHQIMSRDQQVLVKSNPEGNYKTNQQSDVSRCTGRRPSPWLCAWTSAWGTGSGDVNLTRYPPSKPLPPPRHNTTQGSQDSWATSSCDFKMRTTSTQLLWSSTRPAENQRDGTAYVQRPNTSSCQWLHQMVSTFYKNCHNHSTYPSMCKTQIFYKRIVIWPTYWTLSTYNLPSVNPLSRDTYWQSSTQTLPQGCIPYSHLQHWTDQRTHTSVLYGSRSYWKWPL